MKCSLWMIAILVGSTLVVSPTCSVAEDAFQFRVASNLRAGVAKVDITPPADTPVVGHVRPTNGVRDPIRAGVLLLANEQTRAAIVTLDLISASSEMVAAVRDVVAEKTETPLLPEAEPLILEELGRLSDKVLADVFESFKPTTK